MESCNVCLESPCKVHARVTVVATPHIRDIFTAKHGGFGGFDYLTGSGLYCTPILVYVKPPPLRPYVGMHVGKAPAADNKRITKVWLNQPTNRSKLAANL